MTKVWLTRDYQGLWMWDESANPSFGSHLRFTTSNSYTFVTRVDELFGHNFGLKMNERGLFNIRLNRVPIPKDKKSTKGDK
jgi:hypothetical protein